MSAELKVGIGVDDSGLDTGLGKAQDQLKKFGKTVGTETKKVGTSFTGMSRVLQDAAFGPGAIANNLQGLGDDFRQLSAAAKESGQSLGKTLIQSLAGPGGLNLALGGLTLGLSLASFGLAAWTRMFGASNDKVKSSKKTLEEYLATLDAVTQAQLKGGQSAQSELATLNSLYHTYQNANIPLKTRKEAYTQLQELYPDYFKNIKFEKEASEKTTAAYNNLTSSILATARARAANELIAKNMSQQLVNEQKIADIEAARPALIKRAAEEAKFADQAKQSGSDAAIASIIMEGRAQDKVAESINESNRLKAENLRLTNESLRLEKSVAVELGKGAELADNSHKAEEETIKNKEKELALIKQIGVLSAEDRTFGRGTTVRVANPTPLTMPAPDFSNIGKALKQANVNLDIWKQDLAKKFTTDIGPFLSGAMESAFGGIGEALGNALAKGENVAQAFGQTVLSSIGEVLVQFGKLTIAAGVAALALNMALTNPTNPAAGAAAIAAGIALVAVGSAVKSFSGSLSGGGGGGGGSTSAPTAVPRGFQASAPSGFALAGGSGANQFQFTLKGADLVASIDRTRSLNSRQGTR